MMQKKLKGMSLVKKRNGFALALALVMVLTFVPHTYANGSIQETAAEKLNALGLVAGLGSNEDGSIDFGLAATLTREQAITIIVNLLGQYESAITRTWDIPFTDVSSWAIPFVGYAYANGITNGKSATSFGGKDPVTAKQFLTFVLNALGYEPGVDFQYESAWIKSDALGFTSGQYTSGTTSFVRGNAITITFDSLSANVKSNSSPLYEQLIANGVITSEQAVNVGLRQARTESKVAQQILSGSKTVQFGNHTWKVLSIEEDKALMISETILDIRPYHLDPQEMTWEQSSLRQYLNTDFLNTFSSNDKSYILSTHLVNTDNELFRILGGNDTDDRIFLLSIDEVNRYFVNESERTEPLSPQAESKLKQVYKALYPDDYDDLIATLLANHNSWRWWLRSPGKSSGTAATVTFEGEVNVSGDDISLEYGGVRPAFYFDLKSN
jgi:hypothetical protein